MTHNLFLYVDGWVAMKHLAMAEILTKAEPICGTTPFIEAKRIVLKQAVGKTHIYDGGLRKISKLHCPNLMCLIETEKIFM